MAGKTLSYFNLTGGLNTVQTMATINSTPNRTESPDMVNIEYFKLSGIKTMNGNTVLNKGSVLGANPDTKEITYGYEYTKGNESHMLVADFRNVYEYNPISDEFTSLFDFPYSGKITMCGYANGVVACCDNVNVDYLMYYQKDRDKTSIGTVTSDTGNQLTYTGNNIAALGKGDLIKINDTQYEIDSVDTTTNKITLTTTPSDTYTDSDIYLTNFTKIYLTSNFSNQGSTVTITNFTARVVQSHQGRLWVAAQPQNKDTACVLIYSDLGAIHNVFDGGDDTVYDGGYFEEFWEDSSDIIALGTWDKYVVVHKKDHTYLIDTSNSDATTWNVQAYSEYTCDNQQGFVKANNGYYTYCRVAGGIYPMIQRTIYSAISQGADASVKIRDSFLNISPNRLNEIFAVYHPTKKYIMFYMPMIGDEGSQDCYILDLQTRTWLHRIVPQPVSTAFQFDNKVYIGTKDGKIYEEFRGIDFDGQPIKFSWKSPWFIWGGGTNFTTTRELRIKMSQEGTNNFYIRNRRDGNDDYKQRVMTNTSGKVISLLWDEGIAQGDLTANYPETYDIYEYTGDDGSKFYAFGNTLHNNELVDNEPQHYTFVYDHIPTSLSLLTAKPAAAWTYLTETSSSDADIVNWGTGVAYAYKHTPSYSQYLCYQSTKDSNIKAWVTRGITNKAIVNVKDSTPSTKYYGFDYTTIGSGSSKFPVYVTQTDYDKYWNTKNKYITAYVYSNGKMVHSGEDASNSTRGWFVYTSEVPTGNDPLNGKGRIITIDNLLFGYFLNRNSSSDKTIKGTTTEVWNGKATRSGKTKTVSYYSNSYITIEGVRYNRYPSGDEGSIPNPNEPVLIKYGKTSTLKVNDIVYNEPAFTNTYGKVTSVGNNEYTIEGKLFVPSPSDNQGGQGTKFYKQNPQFPNLPVTSDTQVGSIANPYYPNETVGDEKYLTDSKWDFATWINNGQIAKRFPIDRQYFQTLQIEFCGEAINQGIEIYGFEVDGIQLTEVPW